VGLVGGQSAIVLTAAGQTFRFVGPCDRLDTIVFNADALMLYVLGTGETVPVQIRLRAGMSQSIPGLASSFPPGVYGIVLQNASALAATVDFYAYSDESG
jgi:hypothetical protein